MSTRISLRGMLRLIRVDTLRSPQCCFSRGMAHLYCLHKLLNCHWRRDPHEDVFNRICCRIFFKTVSKNEEVAHKEQFIIVRHCFPFHSGATRKTILLKDSSRCCFKPFSLNLSGLALIFAERYSI